MAEDLEIDITETIEGIDAALVGAIDASLASQNLVIAAESMGLGVCYIGGVRDAIIEISELLDIPDYVFPVFGLVVGYPAKRNDHKPRIPFEGIYHTNGYNSNTKEIIKQYDETTKLYYENRSGNKQSRTWSDTAIGSLARLPRSL